MRSGRYEVVLSAAARAEILRLNQETDRDLDSLVLVLLALAKNPRPGDSRPILDDASERVLITGKFELLYRVNQDKRTVEVGLIKTMSR